MLRVALGGETMADGSRGRIISPISLAMTEGETISVVSFFAGCGGLDLGFLGGFEYLSSFFPRTRFEIVAAFDADQQAVEAYKKNIGNHASVLDLSVADVNEMPGADILLGGFPCQDFSQCGPRKGLASTRGRLYRAMVDYAERHQPKIIIGENVAGLLYRDEGAALKRIRHDFEAAGYQSHVWDIRAQNYGVPQARHRIFLVFVRNDIDSADLVPPPPAVRTVTARQAISDLLLPKMRYTPNQNQYFRAAKAGRGHGQGDEKTPADGVAYTIRANSRSRVQFHYSRPRRLTVRECARLQSFPDEFVFPFAATANMRLIGNAVPPVLAHAVARQLQKFLENRLSLGIGA